LDDIDALLEPEIPALRRYAYALLRNDDAADDLVQDCLERALSRWYLRRRDGDLRAWLFTILRNLYISDFRRRRRRGLHVGLEDAAFLGVNPAQEAQIETRDVLVALDQLSEEQKSVLLLVGVEDFSYEEAARILGVPLGTVMSRLARGRQRLRGLLENGRSSLLRRVK
jgi:RNA polymerase sigma-70 factor (ECF subfamily)